MVLRFKWSDVIIRRCKMIVVAPKTEKKEAPKAEPKEAPKAKKPAPKRKK
jgi:hypothetical protein